MAARKALVIGVGIYEHFLSLSTTEADARVFGDTLKQLGFEVRQPKGSDNQSIKKAVDSFLGSLRSEDEALFFFSGHGMQRDDDNFLFGSDADVDSSTPVFTINTQGINVTQLVQAMEEKAKLALLFLDACRTIQLPGSKGQTKGGFSFANLEVNQRASFIGFAAEENQPAFTGNDGEQLSPYTEALVAALQDPSLSNKLLPVFYAHVRRQVRQKSEDGQVPASRNALGNLDFRFASTNEISKIDIQPTVIREAPISVSIEMDSRIGTVLSLQNVPLRVAPSLTAKIAGDIQEGQEIQLLAQTKAKDWYQVRIGSELAYVPSEFVIESRQINMHMIAMRTTPVYHIPAITGRKMRTVEQGSQMMALAKLGNWYKVNFDGAIGFLPSETVSDWENRQIGVTMAAASNIKMFVTPSVDSEVKGTIDKNAQIQVLSQDVDWYRIDTGRGHFYTPVSGLRDLQCRIENRRRLVNDRKTVYTEEWGEGRNRTRCRRNAKEFADMNLFDECENLDAKRFRDIEDIDEYGIDKYISFGKILEWDREYDECTVEFSVSCRYRKEINREVKVCE